MIPRLLSSATALALILLTAGVRAADTIVIGFGGGLTGPLAYYDTLTRNGAQMAVDEINAAGGIAGKYRIDFQVKDIRSETEASSKAAHEFVAGGAKVVIAPCDGELAVAFGPPAQQAGVPILVPCASAQSVAKTVGDMAFQIYPSGDLQAAALAQFAHEQGYKTAFILMSSDTAYTEKLPAAFGEAFKKLGGKVVRRKTYMLGQQDFGGIAASIKNLDAPPDVIMTAASEPEFPAFISRLRNADISTPVLGSDGLDSPTTLALGDMAEGVVYTAAGFPTPGSRLERFYAEYVAKFGGDARIDASPYAATAYESVKLIEAAIAKAGSTDGAAIRDALAGIVDFPGVTGSRITLAGTHGVALREVALIRVEKGAKTLVKMLRPQPSEVPAPR